jgi:hypothetical protein
VQNFTGPYISYLHVECAEISTEPYIRCLYAIYVEKFTDLYIRNVYANSYKYLQDVTLVVFMLHRRKVHRFLQK